jgi:hypothetical protein
LECQKNPTLLRTTTPGSSQTRETLPNRKLNAPHLAASPALALAPGEANVLAVGQVNSAHIAIALVISFVDLLGELLIYQFAVVPHFAPYSS